MLQKGLLKDTLNPENKMKIWTELLKHMQDTKKKKGYGDNSSINTVKKTRKVKGKVRRQDEGRQHAKDK